jgi:photosystem II stability/assembly factor-like uncharacterized protein
MRRIILIALLPILCFGLINCGTKGEVKQVGEVKQAVDYKWELQKGEPDSSNRSGPSYYGISALDTNHVWAVGSEGAPLFYDGTAWREQLGSSEHGINSVSALDANHVWAVGSDGIILFFNGTSWSEQSSGTKAFLESVSALDTNHIWVAGDSGILLGSLAE